MMSRLRIKCARCENFPKIEHKLKNVETTPQEVCPDFSPNCYEDVR